MIEMIEPEVADEVLDRAEINNGEALVKYSKTEAALIDLRTRFKDAKFDLTTTAGDKAARAARLELVTLRTSLEKKRKELKAPALNFTELIDAEAKRIKAEIEALEKPIDLQITEDEARRAAIKAEKDRIEAERVAALQSRLDSIRACATKAQGISAERIAKGIELVEAIDVVNGWEEFAERAVTAKTETLATMRELQEQATAREAEAARVESQRIENERIAAEQAAEAKRLQAIADEQAAQQKAAADALAAQQKAAADKLAEEQAELQRQRDEFAEQQRAAAEKQRLADEVAEATKPVIIAPELSLLIGDLLDEKPTITIELSEPPAAPAFTAEPTLKLGDIQKRLGFPIGAEKLAELGFVAIQKGASKMYYDEQFPAMCDAVSMAAQKAKAEYLESL